MIRLIPRLAVLAVLTVLAVLALLPVPAALSSSAAEPAPAQGPTGDAALQQSIEQLRLSIGRWDVVTEFLNDDGSVARAANGSYEFSWVVPDRVIAGKSAIPELGQVSGILFYINPQKRIIEMVSVGADGRLWVMTGPLGGEERTTAEFQTTTAGTAQMRFTRYNVANDKFESRMEYTDDGGKSWKPGNHQTFRRAAAS